MTKIKCMLFPLVVLLIASASTAKNILSKVPEKPRIATVDSSDGQKTSYNKASSVLKQIILKYKAAVSSGTTSSIAFNPGLPYINVVDNKILVEISTHTDAVKVLESLKELGLERGAALFHQISGFIPFEKIDSLLEHQDVRFVQVSISVRQVGATTTQGDVTMQTDIARTFFNIDGTGVKVGIMSDSFSAVATPPNYANDLATNDLSPVTDLGQQLMGGTDEGRAMLQIVHDIAPGADLYFRTGTLGEVDFALGIQQMASVVDIIGDDVFVSTAPFFQHGIVAQAASQAVLQGVHFFSAAANYGNNSYQSPFIDSTLPPPAGPEAPGVTELTGIAHDFDPGPGVDVLQEYEQLDNNATVILLFQWNQPFASVCAGCPGPTTDLDIGFRDQATGTYVATSTDDNIVSGVALEGLIYTNTSGLAQTLELVIVNKNGGPNPTLIKTVVTTGLKPTQFDTASSTSVGHPNAPGVISVASAAYYNAPPELSPPRVNVDSSLGGTLIFFDTSGNPLPTPEESLNPDVTGPDGGNNTFFGIDEDTPPDGFPNFFGTSAATPHVAGLAALILDNAANPATITPAVMEQILETTAIDIQLDSDGNDIDPDSDPFDFKSGFGLVQAFGPPGSDGTEGAVCGDLDQDGVCINNDTCPTDEARAAPGICGCNVLAVLCRGRGDGGALFTYPGINLPVLPLGSLPFDLVDSLPPGESPEEIENAIRDAHTLKDAVGVVSVSTNKAPNTDALSEDAVDPDVGVDKDLKPDYEGSSCSTVNNNASALLALVMVGFSLMRLRRKRT